MRRRLAHARERFTRFLRESAWAPVLGRAVGIAAGMILLAVIGAGWLDTSLDLGPPRAEAASVRHRAILSSPSAAPHHDAHLPAGATPSAVAPAGAAPAAASARTARTAAPAVGPVILNLASEQDLERLPGVGPAKAKAIVALRAKLGGKFKRFEDLLRVRGIKRRSLERIKEHAVLDPPAPEEVTPPAPPTAPSSSSAPPGRASSPPPW